MGHRELENAEASTTEALRKLRLPEIEEVLAVAVIQALFRR